MEYWPISNPLSFNHQVKGHVCQSLPLILSKGQDKPELYTTRSTDQNNYTSPAARTNRLHPVSGSRGKPSVVADEVQDGAYLFVHLYVQPVRHLVILKGKQKRKSFCITVPFTVT